MRFHPYKAESNLCESTSMYTQNSRVQTETPVIHILLIDLKTVLILWIKLFQNLTHNLLENHLIVQRD